MNYQTAFSKDFDLGFKMEDFPVKLIDKSYGNDICPSFYFKIKTQYFVLWVNHKEKGLREDPEDSRYIVTYGINVGDNQYLEIYDDLNKAEVLITDSILEVEEKTHQMLREE